MRYSFTATSKASHLDSKSVRAMLEGMVNGTDNVEALAIMARGRMKSKTEELKKALKGLMQHHQRGRSAANSKNTYLNSQYKRIAARRGNNRAVVAVAHSILTICYHMLKDGTTYNDLGAGYYNEIKRSETIKRTLDALSHLGLPSQ